jgi:hypothetical protein
MTRLIAALIIVVVCFCAYHLFRYWQTFEDEKTRRAAVAAIQPESLPGVPPQLEESLRAAQARGPAALRQWLDTHGPLIRDPRKAWIELDYCRDVFRDDPNEARRVFQSVKARTPPDSPVWPRVQQMEKTFE